jgi:hypothetical protein
VHDGWQTPVAAWMNPIAAQLRKLPLSKAGVCDRLAQVFMLIDTVASSARSTGIAIRPATSYSDQ